MKAHENPFAPDRVQRRLSFDPELAGTTWEQIEARWKTLNCRAAIIGLHGSGKTTFLKAFSKRLAPTYHVEALFFHYDQKNLTDDQRQQVLALSNQKKAVLLVDGEGHLRLSECRWLRRQSQHLDGYLVARHRPCRLPTLLKLKSSPEIAQQLLERIHPPEAILRQEQLPHLLRKKGGNLRELWLSFYDDYASSPDCDPTPCSHSHPRSSPGKYTHPGLLSPCSRPPCSKR